MGNRVSPGPRWGQESVLMGDSLLMWGGARRQSGKWKFLSRREMFSMDLHSQQWNRRMAAIATEQDEPTPCEGAQCAVIDNVVYSFGGGYKNDEGRYVRLNETLSFDCEKMGWKKLEIRGNKPPGRSSCGLCAVGEKLVMHGGLISHTDRWKLPEGVQYKERNSEYGYVNDCWEFCPHEVSWSPLETCGQSPSPRCGHSLTAITIGRTVLYGGYTGDWLHDIHVLDCRDRVWTWSEVLHSDVWPGGRAFHTTCCVSPSVCVVMGGYLEGRPAGDGYVVDIERGTAYHITLSDARAWHTACCRVASDGSAFICVYGGTRDKYGEVTSVISDLCFYCWDSRTPTALVICADPAAQLLRQLDAERRETGLSLAGENERVGEELASRVHQVSSGKGTADGKKEETIDELATHNTQLTGGNEQLRRRLREIAAEKEELSADIHRLTAADRQKEELIDELASHCTQLAAEKKQIAEECETLRREKDRGNREKDMLAGEIETLTQDMLQLRGRLAQSSTHKESMRAEKEELTSQVQHLRVDKENADRENKELVGEIEQLMREREEQRRDNEQLRSSLMQSNAQIEAMGVEVETVRSEEEELMSRLTRDMTQLRSRLAQSMADRESLRAEKEELTSQVQHLRVDKENGDRGKTAARQVIEGSRRLHQLCESIHSEESSQLIDEDRGSRYLRQTRLHDFHIKSCLGQSTTNQTGRYGCNSIVYRVERRNGSEVGVYVMKALFNPHDTTDGMPMSEEQIEQQFKLEYDLPCCPHPNILRALHHFCESVPPGGLPDWPPFGGRSSMFLIMQEFDGNLQRHCRELRESGLMNERVLLQFLMQILKGIEHLVKHNILHRDLKLENILLKLEENVTRAAIGDFGCIFDDPDGLQRANSYFLQHFKGGNPHHHAPELCSLSEDPRAVCDVSKADVWAVGLMAYEMVTGREGGEIIRHDHKRRCYTADILPPLPGYSAHCQRLLQRLACCSVEERLTASEGVVLCCVLLYGPAIPLEGEMRVDDAQQWLDQQVMSLSGRADDELLRDPFYIKYIDLFCPHEVTRLVNSFLL